LRHYISFKNNVSNRNEADAKISDIFNTLTRLLPDEVMRKLQKRCLLFWNKQNRPLTKPEIIRHVKNKTAIITMLSDPIDADVIDNGTKLKIIANYAVGYNNIDLSAARKRGIVVTNTPGVLTETTADLTWALIMAVSRRIVEGDRLVRSGKWNGWSPTQLLGNDVSGKTLGIIGMGRIGQALARRARGFGMNVVYFSRNRLSPEVEQTLGTSPLPFSGVLTNSDFVSLHVPLTAETNCLIGKKQFARMKKTAYLINTARGAVVDESALVTALRKGDIAGAGLDVFEAEPKVHRDLIRLNNVVLLPHLGSASNETRIKMGEMVIENIFAVLEGRQAPAQITR
jgi:glyoxylate reductase